MAKYQAGQKVQLKDGSREMTVEVVLDAESAPITNNQPGDVRCWWIGGAGLRLSRTFSPDEIKPIAPPNPDP